MNKFLKALTALALAATAVTAAVPAAAADVRVGVNLGGPVYAQPYAPRAYYGAPRVYRESYYGNGYDLRSRREAEWRRREWLRHEEMRREEWRRQQWRHEHRRNDRGWDGRR